LLAGGAWGPALDARAGQAARHRSDPARDIKHHGGLYAYDISYVGQLTQTSATVEPHRPRDRGANSDMMHASDGTIEAYVPGEGGSDEVTYNAGDNHWYTASDTAPLGPSLGVIDGTSLTLEQLAQTINVPAVTGRTGTHPDGESHSVAANAGNSSVFVPHPANKVLPGCLTGASASTAARPSPYTDSLSSLARKRRGPCKPARISSVRELPQIAARRKMLGPRFVPAPKRTASGC
jgi:hypothetical protein